MTRLVPDTHGHQPSFAAARLLGAMVTVSIHCAALPIAPPFCPALPCLVTIYLPKARMMRPHRRHGRCELGLLSQQHGCSAPWQFRMYPCTSPPIALLPIAPPFCPALHCLVTICRPQARMTRPPSTTIRSSSAVARLLGPVAILDVALHCTSPASLSLSL